MAPVVESVHDGLNPRTVAVILDSQSVKGVETVGQDTRGFDGGKLINGRKRHLAVDMRGMALAVMVTKVYARQHPRPRPAVPPAPDPPLSPVLRQAPSKVGSSSAPRGRESFIGRWA